MGEFARDVKENRSYNGSDYDTELKSIEAFPKQKTYALPDRNIISVGAGRFHCFEIWFQSSFSGKVACGINDTSFHSNMKCHVCIRKVFTTMLCCQAARPCSETWLSASRMNCRRWLRSRRI